jgi:hypothetical protein
MLRIECASVIEEMLISTKESHLNTILKQVCHEHPSLQYLTWYNYTHVKVQLYIMLHHIIHLASSQSAKWDKLLQPSKGTLNKTLEQRRC